MKKLSEGHRWWLDQQDLKQFRGERRRAGLAKNQRVTSRTKWRTAIINVPSLLIAERPAERDRLFKVVASVIKALSTPNTIVRLDFSRTMKLYPGGTLILLAYLELLLQDYPHRIRARCQPNPHISPLPRSAD